MTKYEKLEGLINQIHTKEEMLYSDSVANIPQNLREYLDLKQKYSEALTGKE